MTSTEKGGFQRMPEIPAVERHRGQVLDHAEVEIDMSITFEQPGGHVDRPGIGCRAGEVFYAVDFGLGPGDEPLEGYVSRGA